MPSLAGVGAQIILLPVYRRNWVFACKAQAAAGATEQRSGLTGTVRQWFGNKTQQASSALRRQWIRAQAAEKGTFMHYSYRLGQWALSLEHPDETFLQAVPQQAKRMELIYPASIDERFVRRRLRLLIRGRMDYHRIWAGVWGFVTAPLLPLIVSPLPNVPLYYTSYRCWAHYRAWRGAQSLHGLVVNIDRRQLCLLREKLEALRSAGHTFEEGFWPSQLLARSDRYHDILNAPDAKASKAEARCSDIGLVARLQPSEKLDEILKPAERWDKPVDDACISAAADAFGFPPRDVLAHVSRARNRALKGET